MDDTAPASSVPAFYYPVPTIASLPSIIGQTFGPDAGAGSSLIIVVAIVGPGIR